MTRQDLEVLVRALGAPIREHVAAVVAQRIAPIEARIAELEAHPMKYEGVWESTKFYQRNAFVTDSGSLWCCLTPHSGMRPGSSPGAWVLAVKRGSPGKDLRG